MVFWATPKMKPTKTYVRSMSFVDSLLFQRIGCFGFSDRRNSRTTHLKSIAETKLRKKKLIPKIVETLIDRNRGIYVCAQNNEAIDEHWTSQQIDIVIYIFHTIVLRSTYAIHGHCQVHTYHFKSLFSQFYNLTILHFSRGFVVSVILEISLFELHLKKKGIQRERLDIMPSHVL